MRSPVVELFADLAAALDAARVPWYLFGAQAAIIHGAARLTADVDVTIQLPAAMSSGALVQALEERGFQRRIADPGLIERSRVIPLVHVATALPLDVVIAGPGLEEQFFERAQTREIDGVPVRIASAEDVVVMKVLAGRPKDVEDVVVILAAQQEELDVGYVRHTLTLLEQALAQRDLLPVFEDALARAASGPH